MAESLVALGIHAVSAAYTLYKRDGTAKGLFKQAEKILDAAEKALSQGLDAEDWDRINEALALHPELQPREKLQERLKRAERTLRSRKDDIYRASRGDRFWAWSPLARKLRIDVRELIDLDQDIAATTACPDRSVADLSEVASTNRHRHQSKNHASFSRRLAKFRKSVREMAQSLVPEKADRTPIVLECVDSSVDDDDLDMRVEIQEKLDQLSTELNATSGNDFGLSPHGDPSSEEKAQPRRNLLFTSLVVDVNVHAEVKCGVVL